MATMRCQSTLSSEALMSCVGLTLSFHDSHKLSRYFSLDSFCELWKDNVSPAQLIRASEGRVLWHRMAANVVSDGTAP